MSRAPSLPTLLASLTVASALLFVLPAVAQDTEAPSQEALIAQGRYLATAADCSACHQDSTAKNGSAFGGGSPIVSPLGSIFASNITPDKQHGIGSWTFEQFRDAMKSGRSPTKGWLYPAMPYTAYAKMSDGDLRALYTYLMKAVPPSSNQPQETKLPFPFMRPAMAAWNVLFLKADAGNGATAAAGSAERGKYVAEALEHCSTCHTPRNTLLAEDGAKLLSGAPVGNWYAPNITPDKTGIGGWSDQELTEFLTVGHNVHAVAGGDMGLAVERSLSGLKPDDISALVSYLHTVPEVSTPGQTAPALKPSSVDVAAAEPQQQKDLATLIDGSSLNGAQLYQSACASCHTASGVGTADGLHPDLATNAAVLMQSPDNLIMTIADGAHRTVNGHRYAMAGFAPDFNDAQIAAVATYVRNVIGGQKAEPLSADDVLRIRSGDVQRSWLVQNAFWLAIAGIVVALIACLVIIVLAAKWFGRSRPLAG